MSSVAVGFSSCNKMRFNDRGLLNAFKLLNLRFANFPEQVFKISILELTETRFCGDFHFFRFLIS